MWTAFGLVAVEIVTFYARPSSIPRARRGSGPAAGVGQALVFVEHPVLPAVPALGTLAFLRTPVGARTPAFARAALAATAVVGLGAVAAKRLGVDARRSDTVVTGATVAAIALTVDAIAARGVGGMAGYRPADRPLLGIAAGTLVVSLPWVLADAGSYVGDVPLLGRPYLSYDKVHLGHHHGMDGALLVFAALALSRQLSNVRSTVTREALSCYLAVLLVYGAARAAQDAWHEQVFKRGWTTAVLPEVVKAGRLVASPAWGIVLVGAGLIHARLFRRRTCNGDDGP